MLKLFTRHGYESAAYDVLQRDGGFEVRRYAAYTVAETPIASTTRDRGGFRRLFEYIQGDNEDSRKIAMTTPVFIAPETADGAASMAFVVPREVSDQGPPAATRSRVSVRRREPHRVASLRYRGGRNPQAMSHAEQQLRAWMTLHGLQPSGSARFAFYDPPWTPRWLRRNEVQLPIGRGDAAP